MKYKVKNKVVILVTFLIILLSFGLSIANYWSAFELTRKQLSEKSLPLSTDSIYTDIQKVIIEPSLISSMMASDTFVRDWLESGEHNEVKIVNYLSAIKEKYGFSNTFLVSTNTEKYYSSEGYLETLSIDRGSNQWYYRFTGQNEPYEINVDYNSLLDENLMLFFNYKIFDANNNLIGVVGVAFKTSYISKMFKRFSEYYQLSVFLVDELGNVKLSDLGIHDDNDIEQKDKFITIMPEISERKSKVTDYESDDKQYLCKSKYVEELDMYLVVEAELSQLTGSIKSRLWINLAASLFVTLIIIYIILRTISSYTLQLNKYAHHDALTDLPNRRTFNLTLKKNIKQYERDKRGRCFIFFDIDNFKMINDSYGHQVGDVVLVRIAELLGRQVRGGDYVSRWGGEEFSILLIDSTLKNAEQLADKLRNAIANDKILNDIVKGGLTASFGLTEFTENDSFTDIIKRSDVALYNAKQSGKNCVRSSTSV